MEIIFTTSKYPLSTFICAVTGEPVSHCAIRYGDVVIHSTLGGVQVVPLRKFLKSNTIHLTAPVNSTEYAPEHLTAYVLLLKLAYYSKFGYDYGALIFLGLRRLSQLLGIRSRKVNLWESSGLFLCTEFVTSAILDENDSLITPYQLYLKLSNLENKYHE